ncbi:FliC/FljB family flagellin [Enterobacter hormaechei subsp. xiangfangensis]|uniref:FliC/FljB family flagellin n=1 Tax=Enterobacter cloacae complex TaxID=354276 RepID=UPI000F838D8B|nr:FliC/FljB family flagellin [Enterobacter hormaechei]EJK8582917.1 FliC/FljB family flagellin [Enterobacter hormaechei]EKT9836343.1 FliC/FljB family flagellin [Enterobacter hormaechei]ELD3412656.1 FliC/FljB family flagellin [Enterobacter hormaechei]MBT2106900.1 FliC/FljB family flagellin [Enterobacter hormaechei subsp. xiangfangensis]MCM7257012.1 FliC/FljB family flagellin [Enterobacter hormaechei]
MAQVINTNSLSLITQNNINKNQSALSSSIERLSSGLRINSAKDDAAGQAISNRFTSNIKGLTQAARNANDGISLAQTTEGALSEINNNLQRVRELTVQASTGTNSESDLSSIQDEIKSRLEEIDRVSKQTQFNGVNVLSKTGKMEIQVGANDGQTISINLSEINSKTLKLNDFNVTSGFTAVGSNLTGKDGATDVTVTSADAKDTSGNAVDLYTYKDKKGATQYATKDADGNYTKATVAFTAAKDAVEEVEDDEGNVTTPAQEAQAAKAVVTTSTDAVDDNSVKTSSPLAALDSAIASVDELRSSLGAVQNRLSSAVTNLNNTTTNLSEAQSRIQDADYATEVSNMSKAQIIQQAGNSVLSKANQVPQQVLSLLQG